jgi:hypothetical protein
VVTVEWGHGPRQQSVREDEVEEQLGRMSAQAQQAGRPQDVQVTVEGAGTLGIVVGADWSVLNYIPAHRNPPYFVSVGQEQADDPVAFHVAGDHHTETLRRNTIRPEAARAAVRYFVDVDWDEV